MPISSRFEADFSQFVSETNKASAALRAMEGQSKDVAASVTKITEQAPANLKSLGTAASDTAVRANDLHGAFQQFDKMLSAVGVNIGTEVNALGELVNALSSTQQQLGLVGQAGVAMAVGLGAFKITSYIAEWSGLNKQVADFIDNLNGLKTEEKGAALDELGRAGQNAAKMLGGTAVTITDLATAQRINAEAVRQHQLELVTSERRIASWHAELAAIEQRGELAQFTKDIDSHAFSQKELAARYNVTAGALQQYARDQELAQESAKGAAEAAKNLSDEQIKDAADYAKAVADTAKIVQDFETKTHGLAMKNEQEIRTERAKTLADRNKQEADNFTTLQKLESENADFVKKSILSETDYKLAKISEWEQATIAAYSLNGPSAQQLAAFTEAVKTRADQQRQAFQEVIPIVTLIGQSAAEVEAARVQGAKATGDAVTEEYQRQQEAFMSFSGVVVAGTHAIVDAAWQGVASQQAFAQALQGTDAAAAQWELNEAKRQRGEIFLTGMSGPRLGVWTRAAGGPVAAGQPYLVGEQGPEIFRPSSSGTILPNGAGGSIVNNFYINGSIRDLARPLMDEITRSMKQGRQWPAAS